MNTAREHYDQHLASVYSWMAGSLETVIDCNRSFFHQLEVDTAPRGLAINLGAGSGFQSIPLGELGFSVMAVDFCATLLSELRDRTPHLSIRTVHDAAPDGTTITPNGLIINHDGHQISTPSGQIITSGSFTANSDGSFTAPDGTTILPNGLVIKR